MKAHEFLDAVSQIDSNVVERFIKMDAQLREKTLRPKRPWLRIAALAACLCLIVGAVIVLPMLREDTPTNFPGIIQGVIPESGTEIVLPSPPAYSSYEYESYNAVHRALTNQLSSQFKQLRQEQENCGELYQQTLLDFASGEIKVAVPQINGENLSLRNQEGFSNVTLFTSELYHLPWLWYHCRVNEQNLTVCIAYLNVLDRTELDLATSYCQVLKMISPNSPSPDNYKQSASYTKIYEKEITLGNGKKSIAMISELKNDPRIYVCLYLDGMLVTLRGEKAFLTERFMQTFTISYME